MIRFKQFLSLIEAKIDDYKNTNPEINSSHDPHGEFKSSSDIIDHFHRHVPDGNVQHTRWLVGQYHNGNIKQEDAPDMKETLSSFNKYKDKLPKKKIEQYKSTAELKTALHPFVSKDVEKKNINQKDIDSGSTKVYSSPNLDVYHVHTREASCALGTNPKGERLGWCTSHPDSNKNMFNHYNELSGGNFHIAHLHNEQYPYRRIGGIGAENEFQDENNERIEGDRLKDLIKRNPELEKVKAVTNTENYHRMKLSSPNATYKDIEDGLNHPDRYVRADAANHPNATSAHIDKALNDKDEYVRRSAVSNEKATSAHIDKALNDEHPLVRMAAARNPNATSAHLDKALNDETNSVKASAAGNVKASAAHIDKALNDKDEYVRASAAGNPNATSAHLDKALNDESVAVRRHAVRNFGATTEHLNRALNDSSSAVKQDAAKILNDVSLGITQRKSK